MIDAIKAYLNVGFGGLAKCENVRAPSSLPLLIGKGYRLYSCEMQGKPVLSLAGERDDRVQIEVGRILEQFKW